MRQKKQRHTLITMTNQKRGQITPRPDLEKHNGSHLIDVEMSLSIFQLNYITVEFQTSEDYVFNVSVLAETNGRLFHNVEIH